MRSIGSKDKGDLLQHMEATAVRYYSPHQLPSRRVYSSQLSTPQVEQPTHQHQKCLVCHKMEVFASTYAGQGSYCRYKTLLAALRLEMLGIDRPPSLSSVLHHL